MKLVFDFELAGDKDNQGQSGATNGATNLKAKFTFDAEDYDRVFPCGAPLLAADAELDSRFRRIAKCEELTSEQLTILAAVAKRREDAEGTKTIIERVADMTGRLGASEDALRDETHE